MVYGGQSLVSIPSIFLKFVSYFSDISAPSKRALSYARPQRCVERAEERDPLQALR